MEKYICHHGHFYQPPRENPWTNEIDLQPSAAPFHDWNERINAECYEPNAQILNYERMSFNFGPTLFSWMKRHAKPTYEKIITADKKSREYFDGHGNAIAQAYNHIILPLANERDKKTQVYWGIKDFESHFNRQPEGMWLPETAVDMSTLEVLASHGIKFTILAPKQAKRIRKIGDNSWQDVSHGIIETKRVYRCNLASGRSIAIFFYDANMSTKLAFGPYSKNIHRFEGGIHTELQRPFNEPCIINTAVDGETYGHHHKEGHYILRDCLNFIDFSNQGKLTNLGFFLRKFPPYYEVEIIENTAWSCESGLNRWSKDDRHSYDPSIRKVHKWRSTLRNSLDWLRDCLMQVYESQMFPLCKDSWRLRDDYIEYILSNEPQAIKKYLSTGVNSEKVFKLLEMQKMSLFMFTSCGWFFEDIARIETIQIFCYAARAMQIARELTGDDLTGEFLTELEKAESKDPEIGNGRVVYERFVQPLLQKAIHGRA